MPLSPHTDPSTLMDRFVHLKTGLALVLLFIGAKMVASPWVKIGQGASLAVVALLLGGAIGLSWLRRPPLPGAAEPPGEAAPPRQAS